MSMFQLFRSSFFDFKSLTKVRQTPFGKIVVYLVLLSVVFAIPMTFQVMHLFQEIRADGQEIAKNIPDFTIQDGQLSVPSGTKGFIYQTDSIIFTFDPDAKRTVDEVANEELGNLFNIGLLKNEVVFSVPKAEATASGLAKNPIIFSYQNALFQQFSGKALRDGLAHNQLPWFVYLIIFLIAVYPSFLSLVVTLLLMSFVFSLFIRTRNTQWRFLTTFKTLTVCATVPILLSTILLFFFATFDATTFIFLATAFLFFSVIRQDKKERV